MKAEHRQILNKIEKFLEQPGGNQLRFWQALFGANVIKFRDKPDANGNYRIQDDYNMSDEELLKRIRG